jgi:hypothetical protein
VSEYQRLKQNHRLVRNGYPTNLNLRVHRALSWLHRAEIADDADSKFIFLWISFNAAYATEIDDAFRLSEQETFKSFLEKLCDLDVFKRIEELIWKEFSGSIRVLLDNEFVFQSFWDFHSGKISEDEWKDRFARGKRSAQSALASGNSPLLLGLIFNRLYTLRNQLIHGGATWNSSVNRKQLTDCVRLLGKLVPIIIELMIENPATLWGDPCYPVIGNA